MVGSGSGVQVPGVRLGGPGAVEVGTGAVPGSRVVLRRGARHGRGDGDQKKRSVGMDRGCVGAGVSAGKTGDVDH